MCLSCRCFCKTTDAAIDRRMAGSAVFNDDVDEDIVDDVEGLVCACLADVFCRD